MTRWLRQLVDIREGERAITLAMFVSILIVITVLTIVKSVRQALFLQSFGAASLPYVYMMIAAISGLVATVYQRLARNTLIHRAVIATQLVVIANLLIFRALLSLNWEPLTYILYVWVAVYGILSTAQFWAFANYLYDPRQAKRIFAILGVGATAGGIVGGYITQYTAPIVGTENLMLLCCGLLLVCAGLTWYLWRARRETILEAARSKRYKTARAEKTAGSFRLIWESRYLKLIMAIIAVSIVISTVVDNQFSFVVEENIPTKDEKTAFFGKFFTYLGWAAFVTQFLFTGRLLRRFGVAATMLILPLATFLGSGLFVLAPMLTTGLLVKIADGSFRYTTHKAALELLYLPVPIAVKNRTKTFIDVFTDRFSKGIAALIVLLFTSVLGLHYTSLSWLMMGLALSWIIMSVVVRREYTAAFRDALLKRRVDEDSLRINPADPVAVAALAESLRTDRGAAVRHTLAMIEGIRSRTLVAPLLERAHDHDPAVACAALDRLAEQDDPELAAGVADLVGVPDVEVGARALRLICGPRSIDPLKLGPYLGDDRSCVRLAAVFCLLRWGGALAQSGIDSATLEQFLADSGADQDCVTTQRLLASLLRDLPPGPLADEYVLRLLESQDPVIRKEAILAAGRVASPALLPSLIPLLTDRAIRATAREAIAAYGEGAVDALVAVIDSPATARRLRERLPRVLARIPSPRAAEALLSHLDDPDDGFRFACLRSLGRLRARHPNVVPPAPAIAKRLEEEVRKAYRYQEWLLAIRPTAETRLLCEALKEKSAKTTDRIFRLLAMQHPPAELYAASRALHSPNARVRANAIEYLDNLLDGRTKKWVLGLVEEKPSLDQVRRRLREYGLSAQAWPELLRHQARYRDDWLAAVAVFTVWSARQTALYNVLSDPEVADGDHKPIARETVEVLRERLNARA